MKQTARNLYLLGCSLLFLAAGSALYSREEGTYAIAFIFSLMGLSSIIGSKGKV